MAHHACANFIYGFAFHRRSVQRNASAGFFARFFRPHYGGIVRVPGTGVGARLGRIEERTRPERSTRMAGPPDDLDEAAAIPKNHGISRRGASAAARALQSATNERLAICRRSTGLGLHDRRWNSAHCLRKLRPNRANAGTRVSRNELPRTPAKICARYFTRCGARADAHFHAACQTQLGWSAEGLPHRWRTDPRRIVIAGRGSGPAKFKAPI